MKVYVLPPDEDWIVDRFVKEWSEDNSDITVDSPREADVLWLLADWCWKKIDPRLLESKRVLTTVHHIVPEKFGWNEKQDFVSRDSFTDAYHVYNQITMDFIRPLTQKPIHLIHYWANQKIWKRHPLVSWEQDRGRSPTLEEEKSPGSLVGERFSPRNFLRRKYKIPLDAYVIGSFQRDTEGKDLKSPKLEKGPDLLVEYLVNYHKKTLDRQPAPGRWVLPPLHVVLGGWRRQYVIRRLEEEGIEYTYFERPDQEVVNELYQTLNLYPVTARHEGGPQSLIECGLLGVPVVSRQVGISEQVLPPHSISNALYDAVPHVPDVERWKLPLGYEQYRRLIESM